MVERVLTSCARIPSADIEPLMTLLRRYATEAARDVKDPETGKRLVFLTNNFALPALTITKLYRMRWQIELFFKELKSTLGLAQYRFRKFTKVEGWVQACLAAFVYLEWYRAQQLARRDLGEKERRWWSWQRSHGLRLAVVEEAEEQELAQLYRQSGTPAGLKRLRRCLREALPLEYRRPRKKGRKRVA